MYLYIYICIYIYMYIYIYMRIQKSRVLVQLPLVVVCFTCWNSLTHRHFRSSHTASADSVMTWTETNNDCIRNNIKTAQNIMNYIQLPIRTSCLHMPSTIAAMGSIPGCSHVCFRGEMEKWSGDVWRCLLIGWFLQQRNRSWLVSAGSKHIGSKRLPVNLSVWAENSSQVIYSTANLWAEMSTQLSSTSDQVAKCIHTPHDFQRLHAGDTWKR